MAGNSYIFEAMKCNVPVGVPEIGAFDFAKVVQKNTIKWDYLRTNVLSWCKITAISAIL